MSTRIYDDYATFKPVYIVEKEISKRRGGGEIIRDKEGGIFKDSGALQVFNLDHVKGR